MIQFFHGEDTFTITSDLLDIKKKFSKKYSTSAVEELHIGTGAADNDLRRRLQEVFESQGLFAKEKLVIIKDLLSRLDDLPQTQEYFFRVLENPPQHSEIIIFETEAFDKRQKAYRKLVKFAKVQEYAVPKGDELLAWMEKYLKAQGYEIEKPALIELAYRLNEETSLWQVAGELEKLKLFVAPAKRIGAPDVKLVTSQNFGYDVFALTNAVADGKVAEAIKLLGRMVSDAGAQQKTQLLQILGALASQIHSLLLVKSISDRPQDIAKKLGWKEGRVWINSKLAAKFSRAKLKQMLADLKAIDLRLKTSDEPMNLLLTLFIQKARPLPSPLARGGVRGEVELQPA